MNGFERRLQKALGRLEDLRGRREELQRKRDEASTSAMKKKRTREIEEVEERIETQEDAVEKRRRRLEVRQEGEHHLSTIAGLSERCEEHAGQFERSMETAAAVLRSELKKAEEALRAWRRVQECLRAVLERSYPELVEEDPDLSRLKRVLKVLEVEEAVTDASFSRTPMRAAGREDACFSKEVVLEAPVWEGRPGKDGAIGDAIYELLELLSEEGKLGDDAGKMVKAEPV